VPQRREQFGLPEVFQAFAFNGRTRGVVPFVPAAVGEHVRRIRKIGRLYEDMDVEAHFLIFSERPDFMAGRPNQIGIRRFVEDEKESRDHDRVRTC